MRRRKHGSARASLSIDTFNVREPVGRQVGRRQLGIQRVEGEVSQRIEGPVLSEVQLEIEWAWKNTEEAHQELRGSRHNSDVEACARMKMTFRKAPRKHHLLQRQQIGPRRGSSSTRIAELMRKPRKGGLTSRERRSWPLREPSHIVIRWNSTKHTTRPRPYAYDLILDGGKATVGVNVGVVSGTLSSAKKTTVSPSTCRRE